MGRWYSVWVRGETTRGQGSIPDTVTHHSALYNVHTSSTAHPVSYTTVRSGVGSLTGGTAAGAYGTSPPHKAAVKSTPTYCTLSQTNGSSWKYADILHIAADKWQQLKVRRHTAHYRTATFSAALPYHPFCSYLPRDFLNAALHIGIACAIRTINTGVPLKLGAF